MRNRILSFTKEEPVPVPPAPDTPVSIDPVALVNGILDCYKDVTIAKEEQMTRRTQIREQARVCIAAIEANTREFELTLEQLKIERMELIKMLCNVIQQKEVDECSLQLCKILLDHLAYTNPMNNVGKSLQFSSAASGIIGRGY